MGGVGCTVWAVMGPQGGRAPGADGVGDAVVLRRVQQRREAVVEAVRHLGLKGS